jgi:hypothetical protein
VPDSNFVAELKRAAATDAPVDSLVLAVVVFAREWRLGALVPAYLVLFRSQHFFPSFVVGHALILAERVF